VQAQWRSSDRIDIGTQHWHLPAGFSLQYPEASEKLAVESPGQCKHRAVNTTAPRWLLIISNGIAPSGRSGSTNQCDGQDNASTA